MEQNNQFNDDYPGQHGTPIGGIICSNNEASLHPLKNFDETGYGTLFDILCSLSYVESLPQTCLINASFGCFSKVIHPFLEQKINALNGKALLIVAAGNRPSATAAPINYSTSALKFFPACYEAPNVISVTSLKLIRKGTPQFLKPLLWAGLLKKTYIAPHENYSKDYIDIGVLTQKGFYPNPFDSTLPEHEGSSYATAFVTQLAAKLFASTGIIPSKSDLLNSIEEENQSGFEFNSFPIKNGRILKNI
ncbi:MAG: S8 family serine peptidase [Siphonobacter sp.]